MAEAEMEPRRRGAEARSQARAAPDRQVTAQQREREENEAREWEPCNSATVNSKRCTR